jgi:lysophospholipid acyltransferase (LPLAT)-like uncharacterized protein
MKLRSPLLVSISAAIFALCMRLIFSTVKVRFDAYGDTNPYLESNSQLYLYSSWHDSVVMPIFGGRHPRMTALTSLHRDGDFTAKVLGHVGVATIRGSTRRRGVQALREMIRSAAENHVCIIPDGPRGPRRRATAGLVFLAAITGRAIVPTAFAASKSWAIRGSWTELVIPKPFSTVYARSSEPIRVPPKLTRAELEIYVDQLQAAMDRLNGTLAGESPVAKAA